MKKIIWLVLILAIHASIVKRIDDKEISILNPNDTVMSTMGLFRMVLEPNNCSLRMERFDEQLQKYQIYLNCYSELYSGASCNSLEVKNGTIVTDNGSIYAQLQNYTYEETALILDDTGVVKLQGVVVDSQNKSKVVRADRTYLQNNRTLNQHFIESHSSVDITPSMNVKKTNNYNWSFSINNGNLDISNPSGSISRSFPISNIKYN